jgi:hypothetical protein
MVRLLSRLSEIRAAVHTTMLYCEIDQPFVVEMQGKPTAGVEEAS